MSINIETLLETLFVTHTFCTGFLIMTVFWAVMHKTKNPILASAGALGTGIAGFWHADYLGIL